MSFRINDYTYELPAAKIAEHPLHERDAARLLVYEKGEIRHSDFRHLPDSLPEDSMLVFNNTRVVPARLYFRRETGALIEVFCLKPLAPHTEISQAMQQTGEAIWECMAGNQKRWKTGETLRQTFDKGWLEATLLEKLGREVRVRFRWQPQDMPFAGLLEKAGKIPLPPYIHREPTEEDATEYQTVYAREKGAVAAPTAGLHFTEKLLDRLEKKGIEKQELTLHVSAGTFQPVEAEDVREHPMHNEQLVFSREMIARLAETHRKVIAVGTTSMRALESLYWFGQRLEEGMAQELFIPKLYVYDSIKKKTLIAPEKALKNVLNWMNEKGIQNLWGQTEIFIMPGYQFQLCKGLITNFHLPQSTLLMLVAAFIGEDWKRVYGEALEKNYRFLSYGDGSLLLP